MSHFKAKMHQIRFASEGEGKGKGRRRETREGKRGRGRREEGRGKAPTKFSHPPVWGSRNMPELGD